eukprot:UN33294
MIPQWVQRAEINDFEMMIYTERQHILKILRFLKMHTHSRFTKCLDMTAVDWIGQEERFELIYVLSSTLYWNVLRVHFKCHEMDHVDSVTT